MLIFLQKMSLKHYPYSFQLSKWQEDPTFGIDWSVKGYHIYRIKPHHGMDLTLVQDPMNRYDRNAIKVMMPSVMPAQFRDFQENAAGQAGHVPANLCRVFTELINLSVLTISEIRCTFTGSVGAAAGVPVHQSFSIGTRRDRPGGGAELQCRYLLSVPAAQFRQTMGVFERFLTRQELEQISC